MQVLYYTNYLKSLIEVLPDKPGIYQFINEDEEIIYIGKAKNLKKRVGSYFSGSHKEQYKLSVLVKRIRDIKTIVVASESDALLLENNLIKKHQPKYNVLLKDDKSFPWICVKNEDFPRVFSTRNLYQDGSSYYGPYTSMLMVRTILDLIRQLYPLRNCVLNLSPKNIEKNKFRVCLEFHMGNCKAPCIGKQTKEDYDRNIIQVHQILKGNIHQVSLHLREMMRNFSRKFEFEQAQLIKEKLEIIEKYKSKSTIVTPAISNIDVFSIVQEEKYAYVNYLKVNKGAIVQAHTVEIKKKLDEQAAELLSLAIVDIRQKVGSNSREIIVPIRVDLPFPDLKFIIPQKGDKKQLLELSERNAKYYQLEKRKQLQNSKLGKSQDRIIETIRKDLRLKELPIHIECFDNSNIQGSNPVAACVVFKNAKPSKKDYRYYHIKTVIGANDFASMEEVIFRRYSRLLSEGKSLPQLIVVDGGKGQLNAAMKSLEKLELKGKMAIIGIAKKLEEIYFPGDQVPLYIDKKSESLKILQHIRNESHRFGINLHRKTREKKMLGSELDSIKGIGESTKQKLLSSFGSVENIKTAELNEIIDIIGKQKGHLVYLSLSTT